NVFVRDERDGDAMLRQLMVGDVAHAAQYLPPADPRDQKDPRKNLSRLPVTYWHPSGPVGRVLARSDWFPSADNIWRSDARLPASIVGQGMPLGPLPAGQLAAVWSEPPLAATPLKAGAL